MPRDVSEIKPSPLYRSR